ncbi:hypothetical protein [Nocardioides nitrophenolicus]|uniref:hypothetical protein n=1 Tax=Nocardioides nitrophenolicus TaxID=60489 RepID=UPI001959B1F8|nr:hypothetical protein [Nocardioides nitrophenolicus]MBM7516292.1 hypothetical protein [Nocardioides nitrophenolicus]
MKKLLVAATAVAGVALAAAPGFAAGTPSTVAVGGSTAASTSHPWTATSVGAVTFSVRHVATGAVVAWNCASSSATGSAASGPGVVDIVTVDSISWRTCTSFFGTTPHTQIATPWLFHGDSGAVSGAQEDNVRGHLDGARIHVANPGCTFDLGGRSTAAATPGDVPGKVSTTLDETNQYLVVNQTGYSATALVVHNAIGCIGQISNGDPVNVSATYQVTSTDGPINVISQP